MLSMNRSRKACGTCIYWGGRREINYAGCAIMDIMECGKCAMGVFTSNSKGQACTNGQSCSKYQLHPSIK